MTVAALPAGARRDTIADRPPGREAAVSRLDGEDAGAGRCSLACTQPYFFFFTSFFFAASTL